MKQFKYIFILHLVLAAYAFLGIASKLASMEAFLSTKFIMYYAVVLFTLFGYAIVWQQLLKKLPLVTAYANKAVTVVWGIIWGRVFFQEAITINKIIGAVIIIAGVYLVVRADSSTNGSEGES